MHRLVYTLVLVAMASTLWAQKSKGADKTDKPQQEVRDDNRPRKPRNDKDNRGGQAGGQAKGRMELFAADSFYGNVILGSPTNNSVIISILAPQGHKIYAEYGTQPEQYTSQTPEQPSTGSPVEIALTGLQPGTRYYYRVHYGDQCTPPYSFTTARSKGQAFAFGIQGDSHPERPGKMFNSDLYRINMQNVLVTLPDFYFTSGDDFSIDHLIERGQANASSVDQIYLNHRAYFGIIGGSVPLFLINGNHEQAAQYLLDGTPGSPAVLAANARNKYYPLPMPQGFYTGNQEQVQHVGYLRDYYGFEWGDALFVVIDPYWHSKSAVDNVAGGGDKRRDLWEVTLGTAQYQWLAGLLKNSKAKYKFVFTHHVLGTGRGGVECAQLYEWGGYNKRGDWEFTRQRPGWELPIHQLMAKYGVTIFFQGHDHLFVKQELDKVIYQSLPNPADDTYTAFNANAYSDVVLPNSGFLHVAVSPQQVEVQYILALLPKDETPQRKNGSVAYSYIIKAKQ